MICTVAITAAAAAAAATTTTTATTIAKPATVVADIKVLLRAVILTVGVNRDINGNDRKTAIAVATAVASN